MYTTTTALLEKRLFHRLHIYRYTLSLDEYGGQRKRMWRDSMFATQVTFNLSTLTFITPSLEVAGLAIINQS